MNQTKHNYEIANLGLFNLTVGCLLIVSNVASETLSNFQLFFKSVERLSKKMKCLS